MPIDFATPIANQTSPDYTTYAGMVSQGRPFRQPLMTAPNPTQFSSGLEILISNTGDLPSIYSVIQGDLRYRLSTSIVPGDRLLLSPASRLLVGQKSLASMNMLEGPPTVFVYENVDRAAVQTSLQQILTDAYLDAVANPTQPSGWHPSMNPAIKIKVGNVTTGLKAYLDAHPPASAQAASLVTAFLNGGGPVNMPVLPVRAGQNIGRAAPYLASDTFPAAPPFPLGSPTDVNRACRLTFRTLDGCRQAVNPVYYLYMFMRQMLLPVSNRTLNSLTNIVAAGTLSHPIVALYPQIAAATPPRGREQLTGVTAFPIGELADYHGFQKSKLEWHYEDDGSMTAQARVAGATVPSLSPSSSARTKVRNLWTNYGDEMNTISDAFQVPCDIIVGLVGSEAPQNLDARAVRLEPLTPANRTVVRASTLAAPNERDYDTTVGLHATISNVVDNGNGTSSFDMILDSARRWTSNVLVPRGVHVLNGTERFRVVANNAGSPPGTQSTAYHLAVANVGARVPAAGDAWVLEGYSTSVPDPYSGSTPVRAGGTLTWDGLITIVNATQGSRISPGLIQTLISTAKGVVPWINSVDPGIYTDLGIPPAPSTPGGYLNDWLLDGVNSILVGAAYVRKGYNEMSTSFDLPLVGAAYNAGRLIPVANSQWGLRYYGDYVEHAAPHLNAAVELFTATPAPSPAPLVVFMR